MVHRDFYAATNKIYCLEGYGLLLLIGKSEIGDIQLFWGNKIYYLEGCSQEERVIGKNKIVRGDDLHKLKTNLLIVIIVKLVTQRVSHDVHHFTSLEIAITDVRQHFTFVSS